MQPPRSRERGTARKPHDPSAAAAGLNLTEDAHEPVPGSEIVGGGRVAGGVRSRLRGHRREAGRCPIFPRPAGRRSARLAGHADLRRWFERFRRLLPDPSFEVQRLVIGGPVWNQRIAAHVIIRSRVAGEPYENQFAQFLTLRWGKVVEDLILEDTAIWEAASRRLAAAGNTEAAGPPLTAKSA